MTQSWDAGWYYSIVSHGYRYNEDNFVQQNVAWPFFYPYAATSLVRLAGFPASRAMLAVNAGASSSAMMGLVVLGRCAGPSAGTSCIAPAWLAFNPFAMFVFGGFFESLFLLFETLFLIALIKRWWWPAALIIAPLVATRFVGVLAFESLRQRSLTVIALLTATGAAASGLVVSSFCRRLPPG